MARGKPRPEDGRGEWLSELYQSNARAVEGYCRRFLNSAEDAADATHEVFLRALSSLDAPPTSYQARGWLITVAQHYCLDLARRRRRLQAALTTLGADVGRDTESEAEVINRQLLHTVLQQLGERERLALWQSAVERRTLSEIAGHLGLSYMAAAQLVHRARKHASVVAARLAAILGLAAANSMRRRSPGVTFAQSLAMVAVMPLVVVAIATPGSSAPRPQVTPSAPHRMVAVPSSAPGALTASTVNHLLTVDETWPGNRRSIVRLASGQIDSTLAPTLAAVHQAVEQVAGALPLPKVAPPTSLPGPPPTNSLLSPLPTPGLPKPPASVSA